MSLRFYERKSVLALYDQAKCMSLSSAWLVVNRSVSTSLLVDKLPLNESLVDAVELEELGVRAPLFYFALLHHEYFICVPDRA